MGKGSISLAHSGVIPCRMAASGKPPMPSNKLPRVLVPGEVISAIINGTDELLAELREMGVGCYATGGETADVGDLVRTIIVDSTVTCRMKRSDVIDNKNIQGGDVIVCWPRRSSRRSFT